MAVCRLMALNEERLMASRDRKRSVLSSSSSRTFMTPKASWPTRRMMKALMQNVTHRQIIWGMRQAGGGIIVYKLRDEGRLRLTWKIMLNEAFWMLLFRIFRVIVAVVCSVTSNPSPSVRTKQSDTNKWKFI